jgi:hypothetical protein
MKQFLKQRILFLSLMAGSLPFCVSAQTGIFQGGIENGGSRAARTSGNCVPSTISLYGGGKEEGKSNAFRNTGICSQTVANMFGGGQEGGQIQSGINTSNCQPENANPFNGGLSNSQLQAAYNVSICTPESFNLYGGGIGDGNGSGLDANADCFFSAATIISIPQQGCPGTSVLISGTGFFGVTEVLFNGVPAGSFTINSSFSISATIPLNATTGPVALNGQGGSVSSSTSLTILPAPVVSIDSENPVSLCFGPALLIALTSETQYAWSNGNTTSSISVADPGNYWVTVTASNGCKATSDTIVVTPANFPVAAFSYVQENDLGIIFSNNSINGNTYTWDFGNGTQSSDANPFVNFEVTGTYLVQLIAENECGRDTFETEVIIVPTSLEYGGNTDVFVYPNPFKDVLFLRIQGNDPGFLVLSFFDVTGKLLMQHALMASSSPIQLDVSGLPIGIFNMQIRSKSGILNRKILRAGN